MAGTDAKVSIIMYGAQGDSSERHLSKSSTHMNKFERNHTDVFEVEAVNLGALKKVKIWHDNSGPNPKWCVLPMYIRFVRGVNHCLVFAHHCRQPIIARLQISPWTLLSFQVPARCCCGRSVGRQKVRFQRIRGTGPVEHFRLWLFSGG